MVVRLPSSSLAVPSSWARLLLFFLTSLFLHFSLVPVVVVLSFLSLPESDRQSILFPSQPIRTYTHMYVSVG